MDCRCMPNYVCNRFVKNSTLRTCMELTGIYTENPMKNSCLILIMDLTQAKFIKVNMQLRLKELMQMKPKKREKVLSVIL